MESGASASLNLPGFLANLAGITKGAHIETEKEYDTWGICDFGDESRLPLG